MQTTRFRIWLRDPHARPTWTAVEIIGSPQYLEPDCLDVIVRGNGSDLRQLISKRWDVFSAYVQMIPEKGEEQQAKK